MYSRAKIMVLLKTAHALPSCRHLLPSRVINIDKGDKCLIIHLSMFTNV